MKKILSQGLVMFAGIVSVPATATHADRNAPGPAEWRGTWEKRDPRLAALRKYFHAGDCPAADLSQVFLFEADTHHLDWRLLPGIAMVESSGGKAYRGNNMFGWDRGDYRFDRLSAGIHMVASRLANSNLYRDKNLDEMLGTYNTHPGYSERVKSVMRRITISPVWQSPS
ncbi:MAG: hypothetical protein M3Z23_09455 [Acidobacteriota bacterium]|nr:hypothetical protein [Acidobacteriota bacterium]